MAPDKMLAALFESPLQNLEQRLQSTIQLPLAHGRSRALPLSVVCMGAPTLAAVRLGPVLPAWAVIASAAEQALLWSRGPQRREPHILDMIFAVALS